ncbi:MULTISPECIES: DUF5365 family protein [Peribacillus]|uniref:DUF5365 family protein n=1 Tax=Peribacillus frigoritolerans TaxID=450367 RepID=A0AAJ1QK12_9BACI|nr:DUF5365 family protein [Peribacillus frigoritolerans]MCM3167900.1 YhcU family protein [Peribacillus frigoritolerans]MDM5282851.1 DUF5365 family protein [Peribacillus frigoritolerans]
MKTVFSSTEEQEQEIASLVSRFYESVFPKYFTESEILHFREIGVLEPNQSSVTYLATLRDAFQVMTCLQVLMSILDKQKRVMEPKSEEMFQHNITLLNECGIFFPFYYDHFSSINHEANNDMQMMDIQVANQYLV